MIGKHRLTIQKRTRVSDGEGGFIADWKDWKEVYATVKPLSSYERIQYQRLDADISHSVKMRFDKDLVNRKSKPLIRFIFNKRILDIKGVPVNVDERNFELEFNCVETFL